LQFADGHDNIVLPGPPGLAKSPMATTLPYEAVVQCRFVLFTTAQDLVDRCYAGLRMGP
jgi:DNA replication protein DnaC